MATVCSYASGDPESKRVRHPTHGVLSLLHQQINEEQTHEIMTGDAMAVGGFIDNAQGTFFMFFYLLKSLV